MSSRAILAFATLIVTVLHTTKLAHLIRAVKSFEREKLAEGQSNPCQLSLKFLPAYQKTKEALVDATKFPAPKTVVDTIAGT